MAVTLYLAGSAERFPIHTYSPFYFVLHNQPIVLEISAGLNWHVSCDSPTVIEHQQGRIFHISFQSQQANIRKTCKEKCYGHD